ncbi:MAG: hypothetical protein JW841_14020 [Deltaproteobacteria bacterium]|nr:hypothetical protein [Deltaproteobacteria bacterium]
MKNDEQKFVAGKFDNVDNILHLWFPNRKFFLLVNYSNMLCAYAKSIKKFQHRLHGTYRYNVSRDFTSTSVSIGNLQLHATANI